MIEFNYTHKSETSLGKVAQSKKEHTQNNNLNKVMQHRHVKAKSVTHNYYNSSMKPKFHKNTRLVGKIIEKTSLTSFY